MIQETPKVSADILDNVPKRLARLFEGFTVLEILVVVAVIGFLAAIGLSSFSTTRVRARDVKRVEDIKQIRVALELYFHNNRGYPATLAVLEPEYLSRVPRDPLLGQNYHYAARGAGATCGSYHLGATLEDPAHQALNIDVDVVESESVCGESAPDFSGQNVTGCGGSLGADRCYDIVPEILALQEAGIPPPPPAPMAPPPPPEELAAVGPTASYHFSGGVFPKFILADIQPRDVKVGDRQRVDVELEDPDGIVEVKTGTLLDHSVQIKFMKPIGGAMEGCTHCNWEVTWEVNDTSNKTYNTIVTAKNSKGQTASVTLAWTDPCSPSNSGNWTLDASCTVGGSKTIDGVEDGNFTVASGYTLTIDSGSTWVFNDGYSIIFSGGAIALSSGGTIRKTQLWIMDEDGDGYAPTVNDQKAQDTQPTNYVSRTSITGTNDCYDKSSSANPAATSYYTTKRGNENDSAGNSWDSYDYNCDSTESKQYSNANANCS